jgi:signal transduction histidine kinase
MAAQAHEKRTQTTVELLFEGQPGRGFDNAARICIFRFVQEALNNAFRHADGVGQRVQSRFESGRLTVAVVDQGPGFDPLEKRKNVGLGLRGLRERVESQGGTFTIDTAPGRGTRLVMTLAETEKNSDE